MTGRVRLKDDGSLDEDVLSLRLICYKYMAHNLQAICKTDKDSNLQMRSDVIIPTEICDRFLDYYQDSHHDVDDHFIQIFSNPKHTPLRYAALRKSSITDVGMQTILRHKLSSLSMWYCSNVSVATWKYLVEHCNKLTSLEFGRYVDILKHSEPNESTPIEFQLDLPHLRRLTLNSVVIQPNNRLDQLKNLTYLDLTGCTFTEFDLCGIETLTKLQTLILFNVWPLEKEFPLICKLKALRMLDVSDINLKGVYKHPDQLLAKLVEELPELTHLDISGTNLAGNGVARFQAVDTRCSDIPGLVSRAGRPLEFLGLYNTQHSACRRHDIPALKIAGEGNEQQILVAAAVYQDRPTLLTKVLNDLYHLLRFESCVLVHKALDFVLAVMDRHLVVKHLQISGSATLFYILKGREKNIFSTPLKNHIIRSLLNGMSYHVTDETMMRNGCLTLCQFTIPNDVIFDYERLVRVLLHGVSVNVSDGFVQRIAIFLLNSLACQVNGRQKLFLGDLGAISSMLTLISDRLNRNIFDDVMDVAWSTMWNVTDETAVNCERFLNGRGMSYFLMCLRAFPNRDELLRNMMGLLGNVAEVKHLRNRLMIPDYIRVFTDLLESSSDGIEVSYNAAGVLAHIASDGSEAWKICSPSRREVLDKLVDVIERWNIKSDRNINYRSFEPILRLVKCYDTPECQHWAVWALANLTEVYPTKYCHLVEEENGIALLTELLEHSQPYDRIKELASMVLLQCTNHMDSSMELDG